MHAWEHLCFSKRGYADAQVWPYVFACVEGDLYLCMSFGGLLVCMYSQMYVCVHVCLCVSTYVWTVRVCTLVATTVAKGEPLHVCRPRHPKP